jgi:RNA recognition motif-containing protein
MAETSSIHSPILFVGNISVQADVPYLQRLFSAYGHVRDVRLDDNRQYALVTFQSLDDADCSIAALHLRYCMAPRVPIIVLYSNESPRVSEYGNMTSAEYRRAAEEDRQPQPIPLARFDPSVDRGVVELPPSDIAPPVPMAWRSGMMPGAVNNGFTTGLFP